ncbi:hypothetical protein RHDC4_00406 [Rhodocyclaceae bacterium]|nr:hypothetical protein RHDC4_00406 [Rhodocyclaceae bacterium]
MPPFGATRRTRRKAWLQVHLWLGLCAGVVLTIAGITGSVLVFHHEIDEWLYPQALLVADGGGEAAYRPVADLQAAAAATLPAAARLAGATYPRHDGAAFSFRYAVPSPVGGRDVVQVLVNPYAGTVSGTITRREAGRLLPATLVGFMFELHYALLAGATGEIILGVFSVALIFSLLTGLIAWWPLDGKWRRALTIKPGAGPIRRNYDLHQMAGFYFLPVLLAVLVSGIYWVLPRQFMAVMHMLSPETVRRYDVVSADGGSGLISLEDAVRRVRNRFPDGRPSWLYVPNERRPTTYTVCQEGIAGARFADRRCTVLDARLGRMLHVEEAGRGTAGDTFIAWQWPLHSGQAFGWPGRILVFLCGLACPLIFVTGYLRWWHKRRARRGKRAIPTP